MNEERAERRRAFVKKTENIAYQTALQRVKSEEKAEEILLEAYERLFMNPSVWADRSFFDQKMILCLLVDYLSLSGSKEERGAGEEDLSHENAGDLLSDPLVNSYYQALDKMQDRYKIFLYLSHYYLVKDEDIALLTYMRKGAVSRRIHRIQERLETMVPDQEEDLALRSEALERAIQLYLRTRLNELEALSNLGDWEFSPAYDERIDELVHASRIQMDIRRLKKDEAEGGRKGAYYASGILALLLIVFLLRITVFSPDGEEGKEGSDLPDPISISQESQAPLVEKQVRVDKNHYAVYESSLVFYDEERGQVFELPKEEGIYDEFDQVNTKYWKISRKEVLYFAIYRPAIEIVQTLGLSALIWMGGWAQMGGLLTFGVVYAFLDYIQRFFQPILDMAMIFNVIQSAMTSAKRVFKLMDEPITVQSGHRPIPSGGLRGEIEFRDVWFRYDDPDEEEGEDRAEDEDEEELLSAAPLAERGKKGEWILKGVSFHVDPGQFVAFVGATGAGKSTIMGLISRFYDVQKGQVLVDGVDVRDYRLADLRRELGLVQQDVFLFTGDIMGNICIGREELSRDDAIKAACLVRANEFIEKLPKGYDEEVAERGVTLSAGQRQLLSFARTIAANPSILILDEATSNIDTETEMMIQEAIERMSRGRTMLAVAHRISTISGADKIIVMHHGRIAEEGSQEDLIARDGLFRVLYDLQYSSSNMR